jgi:hypothetical protein
LTHETNIGSKTGKAAKLKCIPRSQAGAKTKTNCAGLPLAFFFFLDKTQDLEF